jgi:hypothetical protein
MEKKSGSGINIPDHISESFVTIIWVKKSLGCGSGAFLTLDLGWKCSDPGSGKNIPDPQGWKTWQGPFSQVRAEQPHHGRQQGSHPAQEQSHLSYWEPSTPTLKIQGSHSAQEQSHLSHWKPSPPSLKIQGSHSAHEQSHLSHWKPSPPSLKIQGSHSAQEQSHLSHWKPSPPTPKITYTNK